MKNSSMCAMLSNPSCRSSPQSNPEDSNRLVSTLAHLNRFLYTQKQRKKTSPAQQLTFSF